MDFYAHQDQARRLSGRLLLLFIGGLLSLSLLLGLLLAGALRYSEGQRLLLSPLTLLGSGPVLGISLAVALLILLVSLFNYLSLAQGGRRVAEALGGRLILPETQNPAERRLRNVVEEMAIAAGLPVPAIYVQDGEPGINAFAAGLTISDAVVAVTRGALEHLSRDELQGVIGHEFSHVLNGDMRLNLRLTAALAGLLFIGQLGRLLLSRPRHLGLGRRRGHDKGAGVLLLLGAGLMLLGYVGILWSRLVQAALNRQREYLADASAVQFTRYPQGLANALKKIGGHRYASLMFHPQSETFGHLFFSQGLQTRFAGLFASHPPLAERIRRLEPGWDGRYLNHGPPPAQQRSPRVQNAGGAALLLPTDGPLSAAEALPSASLAAPEAWLPLIPAALAGAARSPFTARQLLFALLLDSEPALRQRQLTLLGSEAAAVSRLAEVPVPAGLRLALLELAMPALKQMSAGQYRTFREQLVGLMQADQHISLAEWILYRLLQHQLGSQYARRIETAERYQQMEQVAEAIQTLLSCLAHQGTPGQAERIFGKGANSMALYGIRLQPAPPIAALGPALSALEQASQAVRLRFLRCVVKAMEHDGELGELGERECELFRTLAVCLDCPVAPPRRNLPRSGAGLRTPKNANPA